MFEFCNDEMLGAPKVRPGGSGGAAEAPPQGEENFEILWSKGLFSDSFSGFPHNAFLHILISSRVLFEPATGIVGGVRASHM